MMGSISSKSTKHVNPMGYPFLPLALKPPISIMECHKAFFPNAAHLLGGATSNAI